MRHNLPFKNIFFANNCPYFLIFANDFTIFKGGIKKKCLLMNTLLKKSISTLNTLMWYLLHLLFLSFDLVVN